MIEDRFLKRLRKKARKGLRGWPIATVAFYGPNLSQATKVAVGIVPSENAEVLVGSSRAARKTAVITWTAPSRRVSTRSLLLSSRWPSCAPVSPWPRSG
jgi:hypothetical protein